MLEAVQVEQDHGQAALPAQHRLGALAGGPPVEEPGELVPAGGAVHRPAVPDVTQHRQHQQHHAGPGKTHRPGGQHPDQIPDRAGVDTTTAQEVAILPSVLACRTMWRIPSRVTQGALAGGLDPAQAAVLRDAERRPGVLRVRGVDDHPAVQQVDDADLVVRVVAVEREPEALQGDLEVDDRRRRPRADVDLGGVGDDPLVGGLRAVRRRLVHPVVEQLEGPVEEDGVPAVAVQLVVRAPASSAPLGRSPHRTGR